MRVEGLDLEVFEFIDIKEFSSKIMPNAHGELHIGGLISGENVENYLKSKGKNICIRARSYEEQEEVLFCGIVTALKIKSNGDVHYMHLELTTQSLRMDISEHIRTVQKENISYKEILNTIMQGYARGAFISTKGVEKKATGFMCQYKESDWEYIKRLASWANTLIYPAYKTEGERFYMGIPEREEISVATSHYESGLDFGEDAVLNLGCPYYRLSLRELYDIGQRIVFLGEKLAVVARFGKLEHGEIIHDYILMSERDVIIKRYENHKLTGAALFARVCSVENERLKVKIEEDENEDAGERFLRYATVYSSPEGGSWYCMPEIGDRVMLRFPDSSEGNVYVQNAIHVGEGGGRNNPEIKFFKNKEGKEIRLAPDGILITDNQGSQIELRDGEGIYIRSQGMISIGAKTELAVESIDAGVSLTSPTSILINQNGAQIELSDTITSRGNKIYLG